MLLPLHPQPHSDEILSSWMVRLALANGYPLHTFYAKLLGYKGPIWNRDTDRHPGEALLALLERYTGQSLATLRGLTLQAYEGILFEQLPMIGNAAWIVSVGVFHRKRTRLGIQFCPQCICSDTETYYRRSWRLAICAVCTQHECLMEQCCPVCQAPVAFHRHGIGRSKFIWANVLYLCHRCGTDLRLTPTTTINWRDDSAWRTLLNTVDGLEQGSGFPQALGLSSSIPFFHGFRLLVILIRGHHGYKLRQRLQKEFGDDFIDDFVFQRPEFEGLSARARLKLMLAACWLLGDWPKRFVSICNDTQLTRSRLIEDPRNLPFWIARVAEADLDHRPYCPNSDEIYAAARYLQVRGVPLTRHSLAELMGLSRDRARQDWSRLMDYGSRNLGS